MPRRLFGLCWVCGTRFWYDPLKVPALRVDPTTNLPISDGGDPDRAVAQPVCMICVEAINAERVAQDLPALWTELMNEKETAQ